MSLRSPLTLLRAAIPLLALVVTSRAVAQTNLTLDISGRSSAVVGTDGCGGTFTVNWSVNVTGVACQALEIWVTPGASCGTAPVAGDQTLGTVAQGTWLSQGSGSVSLPVNGLPVFNTSACPVLDVQQDHKVCAYSKYSASFACTGIGETEVKPSSPPVVTYDTKLPAAPTADRLVAMDRALQVYFTAPSDADLVLAYYRDGPLAAFSPGPEVAATSGSVRVNGLTNGVLYEVVLRAQDTAGNLSAVSESKFGVPEQSFGFFSNYQNAGGAETGGCAAAPASALPLLALGWLRRGRCRRRPSARRGLAALAAALVLALSASARGQEASSGALFGGRPPGEVGTDRTMGLEVKLGGFKPLIDREPGLTGTPYADTYGDNPMLLFQVSGERQFFQALGTAALGISAGYAEKFAAATLAGGEPAAESTGLRLVPLQLFAAYRFDYPAQAWSIPLVPYAKLGLNGTVWSVTKGAELEVTAAGGRAMGVRYGWGFTLGLSLLLDVFEPRMARDFDTDLGVNHSYIFAEYNHADVTNFSSTGFDLSGRYLMFGLAFEM